MTTTQAVLLVLIAVSVVVGIRAYPLWVRTALAAALMCAQFVILAVGFDAHARQALVAEIRAQGSVPDNARAVILVQDAQLADRVSMALASVGLFMLVVLRPRSTRVQAESRQPVPP